ncbi:MAG: hypothetical protein KGN38_02290 [Actinomycetales bacterium]|nr:hypothetical protein [Actinomycetales bacterium]
MRSSIKRAIGMAGALGVVAGLALLPAQAAQADGSYYGAWTLEAFKIAGKKIDCPGELPFPPPAPPISCKAGETLELRSDYTYKSTLDVFKGALGKGSFDVIKFANSSHKTIVFDSNVDTDNPRAYRMKLQGTGSGAPKKMVIFLTYNAPGGEDIKISMILRRDAD